MLSVLFASLLSLLSSKLISQFTVSIQTNVLYRIHAIDLTFKDLLHRLEESGCWFLDFLSLSRSC